MWTGSVRVLEWISIVPDECRLELVPLLLQGFVLPSVGLDLVEEFLHLDDLVNHINLLLCEVAFSEVLKVGRDVISDLVFLRGSNLDLL